MMKPIAKYWINILFKLRHDGYVHRQYGDFGPILTRRDDIRFWIDVYRNVKD